MKTAVAISLYYSVLCFSPDLETYPYTVINLHISPSLASYLRVHKTCHLHRVFAFFYFLLLFFSLNSAWTIFRNVQIKSFVIWVWNFKKMDVLVRHSWREIHILVSTLVWVSVCVCVRVRVCVCVYVSIYVCMHILKRYMTLQLIHSLSLHLSYALCLCLSPSLSLLLSLSHSFSHDTCWLESCVESVIVTFPSYCGKD